MASLSMHILCTGGAGYIGSHTVIALIEKGYKVTVLDNLSNSKKEAVCRLKEITTGKGDDKIRFECIDLRNKTAIKRLFEDNQYDAVIHYAGLKAVGESVEKPLEYYDNNIGGTVSLLEAMKATNCKVFVFSSSATVYRASPKPICEDDALGASNPYGQTKLFIEQMLQDLYVSDNSLRISILRYFNPVGAHPSGRIGESPDYPMNLLPFIQQVAVGRRSHLGVFGNDWNTPDGTGIRDYIHVTDLAYGHVAALDKLLATNGGCCMIHNLGTGKGVSVLELKAKFEKACGKSLEHRIEPRRRGDLAFVVADPSKAERELGWKATHTIEQACESAWKWQSNNPYGFSEPPNETQNGAVHH